MSVVDFGRGRGGEMEGVDVNYGVLILALVGLLSAGPAVAQAPTNEARLVTPREENAARWVSGELEKRGFQPIGPSTHLTRLLTVLGWTLTVSDTSGTLTLHERDAPCPAGSAEPCASWEVTRSVFTWARDSSSLSFNLMLGTVVTRHDSTLAIAVSDAMRRDSSDVAEAYIESPEANETRKCLAWENTKPPKCRSYAPKG